eukprot:CAMPEP_0202402934 /NCGR_PEP_ID=MMETSP1128-20130828/4589_1 /ASSEMBLY_ACC=CAM_ASM_000463 /TAXON_ID=3047 /ORGANISM="Dunaliella tertiolecta, Strain CCMP1320" /LENGTH=549 /DNA_ID=CAMNT_0049007071 /DNA_START=8 /DNA_END=1657 /DNA_ORIENTATION=-
MLKQASLQGLKVQQHLTKSLSRRSVPRQARCSRTICSAAPANSIKDIQQGLRSKQLTVVDIIDQYTENIVNSEPVVSSLLSVQFEGAVRKAVELDARIASEGLENMGPLTGVPIAVKDNICTQGIHTTAGSKILADFVPTYDAHVISRLYDAGAIIIGKANMDEFGMGSSTENSGFKLTRNPWDPECVPGGSSGGSAASVAAGQCLAALGSDTGGSIRQPAHFCGVVGVKPTYGRVSRYGLVSYASSLDAIGPLARSVHDAAAVLDVIAGHDVRDSTSSSRPVPSFSQALEPSTSGSSTDYASSRPLQGKRMALIKETLGEGVEPQVQTAIMQAAKHYESLGAVVEEVSLPSFRLGLPAYYVLAVSEASSNLARYDGVRFGSRDKDAAELQAMYEASRELGLGGEVKRRIMMGTYALSAGYYDAYYKRAQQVRTIIASEMEGALQQYDGLLCPAAPTLAYRFGEKSKDPLSMYKGDVCTVNVNMAGLPAVVVPCGFADQASHPGSPQLPVGLQVVGRAFDEAGILQLAHAYEQTRSTDNWPTLAFPALP